MDSISSINQTQPQVNEPQHIQPGTPDNPKSLYDLIVENHNSVIFDAGDIDLLVNRFTILELRKEVTAAWYHFDCAIEWPMQFYWVDFIRSCKLAIAILRSYEPKNTPSSNHYKPIDVEVIKATVDILDIANRYTRIVRNKGLCPFHSEKTPSFVINPNKQTWHCFGACNVGGDAISLVMKAENTDFKGAIAILGGW